MNDRSPEQSLEWTFQRRWRKIHAAHGTVQVAGMHFIGTLIGIPALILLSVLIPRPPDIVIIIGLCVFALFFLCLLLISFLCELPSRKLRVNRQTITLTDTTFLGVKERRMSMTGAKFRAVYLDSFDRLFTIDPFRTDSAYPIEITRNGEKFLFPCEDEAQQRQILNTIKDNGFGG